MYAVRTMPRVVAIARISLATFSSYLIGYTVTAILSPIGILAGYLGWRRFILGGLAFWGRLTFWLVGRGIHVKGAAHIQPGKRYLVVANHSSMYDIPAMLAVMPNLALVGREKLMRIPVFRSLLRTIGYIPIEAENMRKSGRSLDSAIAVARSGASIGMFPEGTRSPTGAVQRLKRGFVYVLRGSGLDLLPVTIRGTFALKPKKRLTMDPRERIELIVHPPMDNASLVRLSDEQIAVKVRAALAAEEEEGAASHETD